MKTGQIAAVVHDVLKTETFETLADLSDAVKTRCARLKVPYDGGGISDALRLVARTRPLLVRPVVTTRHVERVDDGRPLSRDDAADILARVYAELDHRDGRPHAEAS